MPKAKYNLGIDVPDVGQGRNAIVRTSEQIAAEQEQAFKDTSILEHKNTTIQEYQGASIQEVEVRRKRSFNLLQTDIDHVKDMQQWAEREFRDRLPTEDKIAEIALVRLYQAWRDNPEAVFSAHDFKVRKRKG